MANKIPCYVIVFFDVPTVQKSLDFLCGFSDQLDISVIENPSKYTSQIKPYVKDLMDAGKVSAYYLFEKNISSNAVRTIARTVQTDSEYVVFTDGDLIADSTWLEESLKILNKHAHLNAVSTELSMHNLPVKAFPEAVNWVPPPIRITEDYVEGSGGHHLLVLRSKLVKPFLEFLDTCKLTWTDGSLRLFLAKHHTAGSWVKTLHSKATHLTWDLYADRNHEYTLLRESKTPQQWWDHNEFCGYEYNIKKL